MATHSFSCLKNSMDRRAWQTIVHSVAESDTAEHAGMAQVIGSSVGTVSLLCLCPTQGCHPALTIPGGAEHLFQIESRRGRGEGFLSFASYLPRSVANGPGCAIGWPASPTIPFLSDTSRQASNEKPETGLQEQTRPNKRYEEPLRAFRGQ